MLHAALLCNYHPLRLIYCNGPQGLHFYHVSLRNHTTSVVWKPWLMWKISTPPSTLTTSSYKTSCHNVFSWYLYVVIVNIHPTLYLWWDRIIPFFYLGKSEIVTHVGPPKYGLPTFLHNSTPSYFLLTPYSHNSLTHQNLTLSSGLKRKTMNCLKCHLIRKINS